jgi:hypothetical protein
MTKANKPAQPLGFGSTDQLGRAPFEERRMTIDKKRIAEEAQHFFEWPDPKHRDSVTLTSCVIFAATIAEVARAEEKARCIAACKAMKSLEGDYLARVLAGDKDCRLKA